MKTFAVGLIILIALNLLPGIASNQSVSTDELMRQADNYCRNGHNNEALELYSQVIDRQPKLWVAYGRRAIILNQVGRHDEALATLNYWNAHHPDDVGCWFFRSVIMERNGKLREASAAADRACKLSKYDASTYWERTIIRLLGGNHLGAREDAYVVLNYVPESKIASELCSISDAFCGRQTDAILNLGKFIREHAHGGSELQISTKAAANRAAELTAMNTYQRVRVWKSLLKIRKG